MRTAFRTLLLAGAASLAMSGAALAQTTVNGSPSTISGVMKIVCTDANNAAAQPCFVALSQGGAAASTANPIPVADGVDGPGTNPGNGARGWLSGIYAASVQTAGNTAAISQATGSQTDAATASGANTSIVGALRSIRDRVLAVLSAQLYQGGAAVSASNPTFVNATIRSTGTNRSATLTTTASTLMAANTNRQGWKIKNDCAVGVWISFDGTASAVAGSGNFLIPAGGFFSSDPGFVETGAISAVAASGTCALTAREY